jgi:hypothetical protein
MKTPQNFNGAMNNGKFENLVDQYLFTQKGQDGTPSAISHGFSSTMPITRFNTQSLISPI